MKLAAMGIGDIKTHAENRVNTVLAQKGWPTLSGLTPPPNPDMGDLGLSLIHI